MLWVRIRLEHPRYSSTEASVHKGLGTVDEAYQVTLKPNATPHALYAARNVPIPLREKVRGACKDGTYECDISHVDSPTEWCVGIVVVPKKSGE